MEKRGQAIDLSHHLSDLAKARAGSPLKALFRYIEQNPNIINMAGGVPNPEYFPFANFQADVLATTTFAPSNPKSPFSWLWNLFGLSQSDPKTSRILVPKYPKEPDDINLATTLQYGTAAGILPIRRFMVDFTKLVYQPAYVDFATFVHVGNTDGWSKVAVTLMNRGEGFLTEEWTYPSALALGTPYGFSPVAVKADMQGMRGDDLDELLAKWDETSRGMKRPHVMYTVPVGQNPTGSNMSNRRKKEIYDVCVKYDVIIVEDDPYYFLQEGTYLPKHLRCEEDVNLSEPEANQKFIDSLAPSYLRYDYQGRVVRLDTFSKTIAPGARMGWFTCNPVFAEKLERAAETSTQQPSGFAQALIGQLLIKEWTLPGYVRWLRGLRAEYTRRRDALIDCFAKEFDLEPSDGTGFWQGETLYTAYPRSRGIGFGTQEKRKPLLTFVPPAAGMFVWLYAHVENLPGLDKKKEGDPETAEARLWVRLAEGGILVGPGYLFAASLSDERLKTQAHFRISFSMADAATMTNAAKTFSAVLDDLRKA